MPEKKNPAAEKPATSPTPIAEEVKQNVNPLTGEIDDMADIKVGEEPTINTIRFATPEEIRAMPYVPMNIVHDLMVSKATGVERDSYYANLEFDEVTNFRIPLTSSEYGILVTVYSKAKKINPEIRVKVHCRFVGTRWEDGNVSYTLEVVLCDMIRKTFPFKNSDDFIKLFLLRQDMKPLEPYKPIIRQAQKREEII